MAEQDHPRQVLWLKNNSTPAKSYDNPQKEEVWINTHEQPTWWLFLLLEAAGHVFLQLSQRGGLQSLKVDLDLIRVGVLQRGLARLDYVHDAAQFVAGQLVDVQAQLAFLLVRHRLAPLSGHAPESIWGGSKMEDWSGERFQNKQKSCSNICLSYIPMSSSASREAEGTRGVGPGWGGRGGRLFLTPSFLLWLTNDQISSSYCSYNNITYLMTSPTPTQASSSPS